MSQTLESPHDWVTMGVIHAFKIMKATAEGGKIGVWEADFDYLIDIQRKNLENPSLFENFDEVFTKIMEADLK